MEKLSFENVDIAKINHQLEIDNRFNWKPMEKENQPVYLIIYKLTKKK